MGGNALKEYETRRLHKDAYLHLVNDFSHTFSQEFGFFPHLIQAYFNKQSFGDADFIVNSSLLPSNWMERLKSVYRLTDTMYVKNGDIVSIGYQHFQVDLIITAPEHCESSLNYFAFNDLGSLIGSIGARLGIKVGHKGAFLIVKHKDEHCFQHQILKELLLTTNFHDILQMLGFDPICYKKGFFELEDIFKFVASGKYFDPAIFAQEYTSSKHRRSQTKRVTYMAFLSWIEETKPPANHSFGQELMPLYETVVLGHCPWIKKEVDEVIEQFELDLCFKQVYNSAIVGKISGLTGKELGALMSQIKPLLTNDVKRLDRES